jgi:hypothetical protein
MVAGAVEEDLRLVLEPAEGAAVHDAVAVALEGGAELVALLLMGATARVGAALRAGSQMTALASFEVKTPTGHDSTCHLRAGDSTERKWNFSGHLVFIDY